MDGRPSAPSAHEGNCLRRKDLVRHAGQHTSYAATVPVVVNHAVIDPVLTRRFEVMAGFLDQNLHYWDTGIEAGNLDMYDTYAANYSVNLSKAAQAVAPLHEVKFANLALDTVRRRVQVQALGQRGWKADPFNRARRLLLIGEEQLNE